MARVLVLGGIPESLVNFRWHLLGKMVAKGHQVFASAPKASVEIQEKLAKIGVTYLDISLSRTGLNPLKDLSTSIAIYHLVKEINPDVFFAYTIKPVIYGSVAARLVGVPKIFTMIEGLGYAFTGTSFKRKLVGYIAGSLYRYTLKYSNKVFFLNPDDLTLFQHKQFIRSKEQAVLLNGIGVNLAAYTPAGYPDTLSFLLIGRLVKDKGVYEYIKAASILKQQYPAIKFKLVGFIDKNPSAITEQELKEWVDSGTVEYLGYLHDVRQAITDSSVYVLPSYREGMPVTVMEAMAMARPIITADTPGCRETVKPGENGFLVPVKDVPALVEAMKHFIDQASDVSRMGTASRRIAEEKFDVHKVNVKILETMGLN